MSRKNRTFANSLVIKGKEMKKTLWMLLVALLTLGQTAWAEDINISSASDWQAFADRVNAGETTLNACLTQDVDLGDVQAMVGTSEKRFQGRFDGQGHTLTVHYAPTSDYCAPFRYIDVAKIMNLHVSGTITTSNKFAAGIAGSVIGVGNTVMNCRVSTVITSTVNGDGTHGGLFGVIESDVRMTVSECVFNGKMLTTNGTTNCGGFAGFSRSWYLYFVNCLFDPQPASEGETAISDGSCTFSRKADQSSFSTVNCYYTSAMGTVQGNDGSSLDATMLAQQLGNQWTVADGNAVPRMNRRMISGRGTAENPYIIASTDDWNTFCAQVNSGERFLGERLMLTNDITVSEMAGTPNTRFSGRFYGGGHTLTFYRTATEAVCAPFRYVSGFSIYGLHVNGTIETAYPYAAGIVGNTNSDDNSILNCQSSIVIRSSVNGEGSHGGLVAEARSDIAITDCLFDGSIQTTGGTTNCGGIVGYSYNGSNIPIRNCLYAPMSTDVTSGKTLVRNSYDPYLSVINCYYTETLGTAQGTDASALSANELAQNLGAMWEVVGGKAMPIMSQRPLSGNGTESDPYIIASTTDWHHFCTNVSNGEFYKGKYVKMTQDIDLGDLQAMVGCIEKRFLDSSDSHTTFGFEGTFDGGDHTLTVAYKAADIYCAPFRIVSGATIKNFRTAGTIDTPEKFAAGIVGKSDYSERATNLENCLSSIVLTSSVSGEGSHGGLLATMGTSSQLNVRGCVFNGKLLTTNGTTGCGGLAGNYSWSCTMENSVFAPKTPADSETPITDGNTLVRLGNQYNLTVTNCFYGAEMTTLQGKPVATSITGDEGVTVSILSEPIITLFDIPFYGSGTEVELNYTGSETFSHYKSSTGAVSNAYTPTGTHKLDNIVGDVVISMTNESGNREMYIAYEDDVATYYYDDQRSLHAITGNTSTGSGYCPYVPDNAQLPRKVVVDASFADARPTVETASMFYFGVLAGQFVEEIEGLENLNTSEATDLSWMFHRCKLTRIDLSTFDTHNVVNMENMFDYSEQLEYINFGPNFNTQKVTNMRNMFHNCSALKCLDLSAFETHNVTNTAYMFGECGELTTVCVDGNKWDMSNMVEDESFDHMFSYCRKIAGGKGTSWEKKKDWGVEYAKIDGGESSPGYFWDVNDPQLAQQAYAVFNSNNKKMTFHNDKWHNVTSGDGITVYELGNDERPTWFNLLMDQAIEKVEFLPEFANARPTSTKAWFSLCTKLSEIRGLEYLNTSQVTTMRDMFSECRSLTSIDVSGFDTHNVTTMFAMFSGCSGLKSLDLSNFNTEKVTNMYAMFSGCRDLKSLDLRNFNTEKVTDMESMFSGCSGLTSLDLSNFNSSNVASIKSMFRGCTSLKNIDLSSFNTSKVTELTDLFYECNNLETLDLSNFNTERVETLYQTFRGCSSLTSLDLSSFNTAKVTDMYAMFYGCTNLKDLNLGNMNTSAVTSMTRLFYNCSSLETLDLSSFNTANVTKMGEMFYKCSSLKTIYASEDFVTTGLGSGDTNSKNMFQYCNAIVGGKGTTYKGDSFEYHGYAHVDEGQSNPGYFTSIYDLGYAVYDATNRTMTFYGDKNRDKHTEGTTYGLNDDWYFDLHFEVNKVVFDPTFANARPQSMYEWFTDFVALTTVEGWENLNTSRTTNMQDLFFACRNLTTLDLSHFDMSKVANKKNMFKELQTDILLYLPADMTASDFEGEDNGGLVHEDYNLVLDEDGDGQYRCADLRLTDIKDYVFQGSHSPRPINYQIVTPFHADEALYDRSFTASRRSTIYLPFSFNATEFGTVYSYDGELMAKNKGIRFFPVETDMTEANTPYIIDPNGTQISATDVDVKPWTAPEPSGEDEMIGVVSRSKVPVGAYCYDASDGTLKRVANNNVNISAGRAYFLLPSVEAMGAKSVMTFFGDNVPTDISLSNREDFTNDDNSWYSLSGQRFATHPTAMGIYIHKGKKVTINK